MSTTYEIMSFERNNNNYIAENNPEDCVNLSILQLLKLLRLFGFDLEDVNPLNEDIWFSHYNISIYFRVKETDTSIKFTGYSETNANFPSKEEIYKLFESENLDEKVNLKTQQIIKFLKTIGFQEANSLPYTKSIWTNDSNVSLHLFFKKPAKLIKLYAKTNSTDTKPLTDSKNKLETLQKEDRSPEEDGKILTKTPTCSNKTMSKCVSTSNLKSMPSLEKLSVNYIAEPSPPSRTSSPVDLEIKQKNINHLRHNIKESIKLLEKGLDLIASKNSTFSKETSKGKRISDIPPNREGVSPLVGDFVSVSLNKTVVKNESPKVSKPVTPGLKRSLIEKTKMSLPSIGKTPSKATTPKSFGIKGNSRRDTPKYTKSPMNLEKKIGESRLPMGKTSSLSSLMKPGFASKIPPGKK